MTIIILLQNPSDGLHYSGVGGCQFDGLIPLGCIGCKQLMLNQLDTNMEETWTLGLYRVLGIEGLGLGYLHTVVWRQSRKALHTCQ